MSTKSLSHSVFFEVGCWGFVHGALCIVAWRAFPTRNQRISMIAIAVVTAVVAIYFLEQKRRLNTGASCPASFCKKMDSPYPLNEWDNHYLMQTQALPMVDQIEPNTLWFPHHMAVGDREYQSLPPDQRKSIWTGILPGSDAFVCKTRLAVFARHMSTQVQRHLPESLTTIELSSTESISTPGMAYIGKTNEQRQNGVVIFQNRLPKQDELASSTAILQKLVEDPLLVDGHKVTHRVYVVCWISGTMPVEIFRYKDGFLYYTSLPYDATSEDLRCHVASGYNSRTLYEKLPLTHQDLYMHDSCSATQSINIETQIDQSIAAVLSEFCDVKRGLIERDCRGSFQLFGVDVQVTQNGRHAYILECNKSPNLEAMDERDKQLKQDMSNTMWKEVVGPKLGFPDKDNDWNGTAQITSSGKWKQVY